MCRVLLVLCCFLLMAASKPQLLLAEVYRDDIAVGQYWISEKLDGVRAYWDGKQLISRGGERIAAPAWFIQLFPKTALDGELWLGRNQFAATFSIVSKLQPQDHEWQRIQYHIFELPNAPGTFTERISAIQRLLKQLQLPLKQLQLKLKQQQLLQKLPQQPQKQPQLLLKQLLQLLRQLPPCHPLPNPKHQLRKLLHQLRKLLHQPFQLYH